MASKRIKTFLAKYLEQHPELLDHVITSSSADQAPTLRPPNERRRSIMDAYEMETGRAASTWLQFGDAFLEMGREGVLASMVGSQSVPSTSGQPLTAAPVAATATGFFGVSDDGPSERHGRSDIGHCPIVYGLPTIDPRTDPLLRIFASGPTEPETPSQRSERIGRSYDMFEALAQHAADGHIRSLIISGPPGLGKSYTVETAIAGARATEGRNATIIKGSASALEVYVAAFDHSGDRDILVLDDTDSIFDDADGINLLKALTDTGGRRSVSWLKRSPYLDKIGVPQQFYFKGTVIILSNIPAPDEDDTSTKALHLRAVYDRAFHVELQDSSLEDVITRIEHVLPQVRLDGEGVARESFEYLRDNAQRFRTLTIRTLLHIEQLRRLEPEDWRELVARTKF